MIKMFGVFALTVLGVCLSGLIIIGFLIFAISIVEKIFITGKELRNFRFYEKIETYIYRSRKDLNSRSISKTIKLLWNLEEVYLVPIPLINVRVKNTAIISSYKFRSKLCKLNSHDYRER